MLITGLTLTNGISYMLSPYHSRLFLGTSATFLSLTALVGQIQKAEAVNITFDYTYDNNNFFADSSRKDLLDQAAGYFETNINDSLPELNPTSPETLTLEFTNPSDTTAPIIELSDRTIAENQILIFAGSDELGSNTLGFGEKSGSKKLVYQDRTTTFNNAYETRKAEASLWGGSLSFDLEYDAIDAPNGTKWHFGSDTNGLDSNEADFLSVAIHEIAHVMGFGTSSNWDNLVSGTNFTGAKSQDIFNGLVPLDSNHWNDNITIDGLETAMDTTITNGDRKLLTRLDYAGLEDIGWGVNQSVYNVPFEFSPSLGILVVAGMFGTKKVLDARKIK